MYAFVAQDTLTLPMSASSTAPPSVPAFTVQVCDGLAGCVRTVIAYRPPLATGVRNWKRPAASGTASSPPLLRSTRPPPSRPAT
ncbi:hypothetical protein [Roseateles sp. L2-2]|uniref:hypothetical protein n=1 Tax=Roseateles sp. L2-2 TaxID=3422597 RepID=UPI003D36675F